MKLRLLILSFLFSLYCSVGAQEIHKIPANYQGLSFSEFETAAESIQKIKFFYKEEWVKDLKLGDYPGTKTLTDILDNLFKGTSLYYYIDRFGNIVLTKYYNVKIRS